MSILENTETVNLSHFQGQMPYCFISEEADSGEPEKKPKKAKPAAKQSKKQQSRENGEWEPPNGVMKHNGIWYLREIETYTDGEELKKRTVPGAEICPVFEPLANVISTNGAPIGLRIRFKGKEATVYNRILQTDRAELCNRLNDDLHMQCGSTSKAKEMLGRIFDSIRMLEPIEGKTEIPIIIEADKPGWCMNGAVWVGANGAIVSKGNEDIRLSERAGYKERAPEGVGSIVTEKAVYADVWQPGSPKLWKFTDLIGLASPVQQLVDCRSGGIAITGFNGSGKTTAQQVQTGRGGCPDDKKPMGGIRRISDTAEGMEMPLRNASGNPFAIDELGNMKNFALLEPYLHAIATGYSKPRLARTADHERETNEWQIIATISAEKSISELILRETKRKQTGGIVRRFPPLNISGLCDKTEENGKLADRIKDDLRRNYGHTLAEFVQRALIHADKEAVTVEWRKLCDDLQGDDVNLRSASEIFGLIWLAGNLAADCGLTAGLTREAVREVVWACWRSFAGSDEAGSLAPGEVEVDALRENIFDGWNRTIVSVDRLQDDKDRRYGDLVGFYVEPDHEKIMKAEMEKETGLASRTEPVILTAEDYGYIAIRRDAFDKVTGFGGNRGSTLDALDKEGLLLLPPRSGDKFWQKIRGLGQIKHFRLRYEGLAPDGNFDPK
jgi:uncharacterized protein DUF927